MTKMHRYAAIAALAIFLSGCMAQRQPAPVEEVKTSARTTRAAAAASCCAVCANDSTATGADRT
ncbi:Lipoprotein YcfM part of a salvage pathway ofuncharacterised substrate [Salmonella sp. NCTC 11881]|nr:Lipoprotein YcfM part of a salvage pathway ofuncharacterised substrate [Salmonella sp. NCTC 11881]